MGNPKILNEGLLEHYGLWVTWELTEVGLTHMNTQGHDTRLRQDTHGTLDNNRRLRHLPRHGQDSGRNDAAPSCHRAARRLYRLGSSTFRRSLGRNEPPFPLCGGGVLAGDVKLRNRCMLLLPVAPPQLSQKLDLNLAVRCVLRAFVPVGADFQVTGVAVPAVQWFAHAGGLPTERRSGFCRLYSHATMQRWCFLQLAWCWPG